MTARLIRDMRAVLLPWMVSRVLVIAGYVVARSMGSTLSKHGERGDIVGVFGWDAAFYRTIALHGYAAVSSNDGLRFFPLYPLLGRLFGASNIAMLGITNIAMLFALVLTARLVKAWLDGDEGLAKRAVWIVAIGPGVTATAMGYAEPLFLMLALGCALALHHDRVVLAGVLGAGAALARPVGIVLVVMFVAHAFTRRQILPLLGAVGPVIGMGAFFAWAHDRTGDWLRPLHLQSRPNLRGENVDPIRSVWTALHHVVVDHRVGPGMHLVWAAIAIALCVVATRRLPLTGAAFAISIVLLSLTTRNLDSYERYLLSAFPLAIAAATVKLPKALDRGAFALMASSVVGYSALAFATIYVP